MSHPSPLLLERFSVNDLSADVLRETKGHVDGCETCARYLAELEEARDARLAAVPPAKLLAQVAAKRSRVVHLADRRGARLAGVAAVLVAAAALLLFLRRPEQPTNPDGVNLKGAGVSVQRSRGADVHVLADEETIREGDALRIVVTQPHAAPVAVWFVDTTGRVDRFLRDPPIALPAGETPLPGSARVDSPCRDLALVLLAGSPNVKDFEQRMTEAIKGGAPIAGDSWIPHGAVVRRLRCE